MIFFDVDGVLRNIVSPFNPDGRILTSYDAKCENGLTVAQNWESVDSIPVGFSAPFFTEMILFAKLVLQMGMNVGFVTYQPSHHTAGTIIWIRKNLPLTTYTIEQRHYAKQWSNLFAPILFKTPLDRMHMLNDYDILIDDNPSLCGHANVVTPKRSYNSGEHIGVDEMHAYVNRWKDGGFGRV